MNLRKIATKVEQRLWYEAHRHAGTSGKARIQRRLRCRDASTKFRRTFGRPVDRENPTLFTEKIVARILADEPLPLQRLWDDKATAPLYVEQVTSHPVVFPERLGIWPTADARILAELPRPFIIKGNFGSGVFEMVHDDTDDLQPVADRVNRLLAGAITARGTRYEPCVIAEKLLTSETGEPPADFKFHCFHQIDGSYEWFLEMDTGRFDAMRRDIFDSNLEPAAFRFATYEPSPEPPELPANIADLVAVARDLSSNFDYMRIDLYSIGGSVVFGEFSPWPAAGNSPIVPREWEKRIGEMWDWNPRGFSFAPEG